jgi:hypothetical protein
MDTLSHRWEIRQGETVKNHVRKHERNYVDFIVSGRPLSEVFQTKESDMISIFGWGVNKDYEKRTIKEFLKQEVSELETGRTIIYGCSECGDIGCGAITAEILDEGDKIIWRDFGYENNYSGFDLEDYRHIPPFVFDKKQYFAEFDEIEKELIGYSRKKDD